MGYESNADKYTETREPYVGWTIYKKIYYVGNHNDVPMMSLYNPKTGDQQQLNVARFIINLKLGRITSAKNDGDIVYLDGNKNNLDPSNLDLKLRSNRAAEVGIHPFDDRLVDLNYGMANGKPAVGFYDISTRKYLGYMATERYWLSVKEGRIITKVEGRVKHKDGNKFNNSIDNLELIPSALGVGEGIYEGCKIETRYNKTRRRWMVRIYDKDPVTGYWIERYGTSRARYRMQVALGYELPKDVEVDHINGDKTDDRLENLQVVSPEENKYKAVYTGENNSFTITTFLYCNECGKLYSMDTSRFNVYVKDDMCSRSFCCKECKSKYMKRHNIGWEDLHNVEPKVKGIAKVHNINKEYDERVPEEVKRAVKIKYKKASPITWLNFGPAYYVTPIQLPIIATQFELYNVFGVPINPITSPSSDETLNKEYVFKSIPFTPFDI